MEFAIFLLVNAALFIRPGEISPTLAPVPIYLILILLCLAASAPKLIAQWTSRPLSRRPVTICMLGLLVSVGMSHAGHLDLAMGRYWATDFAKVVLYFLIFVAVVDTPTRLNGTLTALMLFIAVVAALALCQYNGVINVPTLRVLNRSEMDEQTGEFYYIIQLVGTGIFNDPNDFSLILAFGCLISVYKAGDRRFGMLRGFWLAFFGLFSYAMKLTQSRGGVLALAAGLITLLACKIGFRKAAVGGALAFSVALPLLGGRLAKISTNADTAQERLHLWSDALMLFRGSPLFGIGVNRLDSEIGLVAHNSYVHAFAEMGLLGGTCFLGIFISSAAIFWVAGRRDGLDPEMKRSRSYLLAFLATIAVGLFSLTRCYVTSTYVSMALAEAYQNQISPHPTDPVASMDRRLVLAIGLASLACLVGIAVFLRLFLVS